MGYMSEQAKIHGLSLQDFKFLFTYVEAPQCLVFTSYIESPTRTS